MIRIASFFAISAFVLVGCGDQPFEIAKVSGKVVLNSKPVPGAVVSFEPIGSDKELGPGSIGETDNEGRYSLTTIKGAKGAVVGKHRVVLSTLKLKKDSSDASIPKDDDTLAPEIIPEKYAKEPLTYEVPSGGTDSANFELTGPPPKRFTAAQMLKGRRAAPSDSDRGGFTR